MNILVLNPGSATLKFAFYQMPELNKASTTTDSAKVLASGIVEPIGATQSELKMFVGTQKPMIEAVEATTPVKAVEQIIRRLLVYLGQTKTPTTIDAVGCRVVHGGPRFVKPTRVTSSVLEELRTLKDLAPLHIPADIAVLEQVQQSLPQIPVIAVFDTAFHQTLPPVAYTYALPVELSAQYKLRRYGFHGISHAYVSGRLIELLGRGAEGTKIISCHLGSGASVCAVRDGQSIDTSMGLTPVEGLVMGTRSGDVDPGLVLYLIRAVGISANEVDSLLNNQSGLRGLSGLSADVRELEQAERAGDKNAELALEVFAYHARKYIGAYLAAMNGADAIIFTGGIGENSPAVRAAICEGLSWFGIELDAERNAAHTAAREGLISAESSRVAVYVIPTNEELLIARDTSIMLRSAN